MAVTAKFKCTYSKEGAVHLSAVYDSNPESENGKFFKYTPAGDIHMEIVNEEASEQFKEDKEYFVTFQEANLKV